MLKEEYIRKCVEICPNEDELCNIVLDICYTTNNSKQFAWDVCVVLNVSHKIRLLIS